MGLCTMFPCSETIEASWPKMLPSSVMVDSIASIAWPLSWMYEFCGWASSMTSSCWSPTGFRDRRSAPGEGVPRFGVPYSGDEDCCMGRWAVCETVEMKLSVLDLDAWMFLVRTSNTSYRWPSQHISLSRARAESLPPARGVRNGRTLKLAETSVSFPWRRKTILALFSPSWSRFGWSVLDKTCRLDIS